MPGAFDPQEPAQRADSVGDSQETVAVRVGAADAILADFKREDAVVDRGPDCRPRRIACLTAFVSVSATMKYALASMSAGSRSTRTRARQRQRPRQAPGLARR